MLLNWIRWFERAVGLEHPTLADTINRPLRELLTASGVDPDGEFPGFTTADTVDTKDAAIATAAAADATGKADAAQAAAQAFATAQDRVQIAIGADISFADNVITATRNDGVVVTTTFNTDGTITTSYGAPVSRTVTTTFNADGSISEAVT